MGATGWGAMEFLDLCKIGNARQVKEALEAGADANARVGDELSALMMIAVSQNDTDMIELLLQAGADVNAQKTTSQFDHTTALVCAIREGNLEAVDTLLKAGADFNVQDSDGTTLLMRTATLILFVSKKSVSLPCGHFL